MMNVGAKIESVLFFKSEPVTIEYLSKILKEDKSQIEKGIGEMKESLSSRGIAVIENGENISLGTHPDMADFIKDLAKEEVTSPLTKATLETLSVILYRAPITKSEIDYIRGVNSHFILRNLLIRGLIEKSPNPKDARTFLYKPTLDLLSYLGIKEQRELPEYESYTESIKKALEQKENEGF